MAKGFDELVNFLLDEVALRFAEGATLNDFKHCVTEFYNDPKAQQDAAGAKNDSRLLSTADHQLQERAWIWLLLHPDIWVGRPAGEDGSLPDILVAADQDASVLSLIDAESADLLTDDESKRIRIWTSHERVWQTVAGHGVDFKRIPGEEFRLLCLIAGAREKGIAQPELVRMSKQDKKSVPGRTDNLNKVGYIRKTKILAEKHNTSLLVHRRFLPEEELDAISRPVFINGSLSFENLLGVLMEKLKNGVEMKMESLEEFVGCSAKSWEKRALWRALERLDIIGIIQRYRMDEVGKSKKGNVRSFKAKYLKLLREPNDADFKKYTSLTFKDREDFRRRLEAQDAETQGEHAEYMDDEDDAVQNTLATPVLPPVEVMDTTVRIMHWDPDVAWTNTVYHAVKLAGVKGLSSMASRESTYGRFYDRPVEQMLARLTDVWEKAQPDHLKYFSIIRDTDTKGRSTNYLYRSHDAFQEAVDQGDAVWENATSGQTYQKSPPQLDRFGFGKLESTHFLKHGTATLAEGNLDAKIDPERLQRSDPVLSKTTDGSYKVVWNHGQARKKPRKNKNVAPEAEGEVEAEVPTTPKRRGRPRTKDSSNTEKKKEPVPVKEPPAPVSKPSTILFPRGVELRIAAEEKAFHEAHQKQKLLPVTSAKGKQIIPTWKPGKGRAKMILVDDVESTGDVDLPEMAPGQRKPPVVVFESQIREIMKTMTAESPVASAATTTTPANAQSQVIIMKVPRLGELSRSQASDARADLTDEGDNALSGVTSNKTNTPGSPVAQESAEEPTVGPPLQDALVAPAQTDLPPSLPPQNMPTASKPSSKRPATPPQRSPSTQKRHKANNYGQSEDLAAQVGSTPTGKENETPGATPRKDWSQRQSTYIRPGAATANRKKKGTVVGRGTAQYKRIILIEQIIDKSGGIFPGDSEMVTAFQKLQRGELKSEIISDRDTIMKAVKSLVDDEKLKRFAFFFKDKNDKQVQKWILHQPQIEVGSQAIKDLMSKIEEAHPRNYVPPPYGDGETGRAEQRKNIDRFQYRPGKSIIQPSGTEFVIDIEAKRRELEAKRLAAAAAIRAEEQRRLKEQAARNKKRQAALVGKPRFSRAVLKKTAQPDPRALEAMNEDDPDEVVQSVETDGIPVKPNRLGRTRYRSLRPGIGGAYPVLGSHKPPFPGEGLIYLPGGQALSSTSHQQPRLDHPASTPPAAVIPSRILPSEGSGHATTSKTSTSRGWTFKKPQGPQTYNPYYEFQDTQTLLRPLQRFHPNTGTFSTDFFVRVNVRQSNWLQPNNFAFEHRSTTDQRDLNWYNQVDDYDNFYHPDKKMRKTVVGALPKKPPQALDEDDSDARDDQTVEGRELRMMRNEYPNLIHQPVKDGFASYIFGAPQETAREVYHYGIQPMAHIVLHGVDQEDFVGVQFEDRLRRPNIPSAIQDEFDASAEEDDEDDDHDEEEAPEVVPTPRTVRTQGRPRSSRRATLDHAPEIDNLIPPQAEPREKKTVYHQSGKCYISSAQSRRLFFACIIVRVLCGDLDGTISWNVLQDIFAEHPNFDLPTFKARWARMYHSYKDVTDRVQREFQDAFLVAYEKGLLPSLNVMHGSKLYYKDIANWNRVIDWAVKTIPVFSEDVELPATHSALDEAFEISRAPSELQDVREKLEHVQTTHAKRDEITHGMSFAAPLTLRKKKGPTNDIDVGKSWIRANCATPDDKYDAEAADTKLKNLDQAVLMALTKQLHAEKIIAHSFKRRDKQDARNYHLSDQYNQIFDRRPLSAKSFSEAMTFKAELDKIFTSATPRLRLDYNLSDAKVMVVSEMIAAGRVSMSPVLPPVNSTIGAPWPRLTVWGFNEGQYKLRNMDRKTFVWEIELRPTDHYVAGFPLATKLDTIEPPKAPKQNGVSRELIPLWYDIHGNFIPKLWEGMVRSVAQHIAMKSGSSIATLSAPYRGLVWEWEVQMLVDWLIRVGAARHGKSGAVMATEWWWTAVPKKGGEQSDGTEGGTTNGVTDNTAAPAALFPAPKKRRVRGGKAKNVGRGKG